MLGSIIQEVLDGRRVRKPDVPSRQRKQGTIGSYFQGNSEGMNRSSKIEAAIGGSPRQSPILFLEGEQSG